MVEGRQMVGRDMMCKRGKGSPPATSRSFHRTPLYLCANKSIFQRPPLPPRRIAVPILCRVISGDMWDGVPLPPLPLPFPHMAAHMAPMGMGNDDGQTNGPCHAATNRQVGQPQDPQPYAVHISSPTAVCKPSTQWQAGRVPCNGPERFRAIPLAHRKAAVPTGKVLCLCGALRQPAGKIV